MTIGSLAYVVNDGLVRLVSERGIGVYQVLFMRSVVLVIGLHAIGVATGSRTVRRHIQRNVLLRVGAEMTAAALFFAAIVRMEFANAQAILQIVPFAVTLAAALVLSERVSVRQYATIAVGFIGVLIVVRPATEGFTGWSVAVLASAAVLVVRELATRDVDRAIPATSIAFLTALGLALLTGILAAIEGWVTPDGAGFGLLLAAAASLAVGYHFTIQTVRIGDLSVSAPFRYSILVGAVAVGYLLFDEVPDPMTLVGVAVIMASGLYAVQLQHNNRPEKS